MLLFIADLDEDAVSMNAARRTVEIVLSYHQTPIRST